MHGLFSLPIVLDFILDLFRKEGANVDLGSRVIRLPADMIEAALKAAPSSFVFYGRDPEMDLLVEPGRVHFGMGGTSEPFLWDYENKVPREPSKTDMVNNTRVGQAAENIDFVMALCSAGDAPKDQVFLHEYDAIFRNTTKPVLYTAPGAFYSQKFLEMAIAASGGEEAFRERPWLMLYTQPDSPMQINHYNENMIEAAKWGVPILVSPGAMMGGTSPAAVAGALVQINAETLLGITLAQLIRSGTPVVYGPHTAVMDMVTGQCTYGSAEQTLGRIAVAQLGRFYNLPTLGLGGGVEAKSPDGEAAAQAMMGMLINALSGITLTQTLGTLASGLYGSPEMALICDEMVHMIKRITAGIRVDDETLSVQTIQDVGYGGEYISHDDTAKLFRRELFLPVLFRRQSIDQWLEDGAKTILDVAHERVQQILAQSGPVPLPEGADKALDGALHRAIEELEKLAPAAKVA